MQLESVLPASCRLRVLLHGPLLVSKRVSDGSWIPVTWGQSRIARSVFRRLLAAPGRHLSRGQLADDLWPESDFEAADSSLQTAISLLRSAIGKDLVTTWDGGYEVAGQTLVWVDLDAAETLLKAVENQGPTALVALPSLEEALLYLERGVYLEEESGAWCYQFRKKSEDLQRSCRLWLAESYEKQGKLLQASLQYRALLQIMPPNEHALQRWITMLHHQGETPEAQKLYQEIKVSVEAQGFTLSPAIEETISYLSSLSSLNTPSSPIQMLSGVLGNDQIHTFSLFSQVLMKTPQLDEITFQYLEICTEQFWRNRQSGVLSSHDLYRPVNAHLKKIMALFTGSLIPTERTHLCCLLSQTAQLLGELSLDMGLYTQGKTFHQAALVAAQEAKNHFLAGVAWGRISLAHIYSKAIPDALFSVQQAQELAKKYATPMIQGWLAAIEAEIRANLSQPNHCLKALEKAASFDGRRSSPLEDYLVRFDRSLLGGYQGVSYRLLSQPSQPQSPIFLQKARNSLQKSITSLHPSSLQRKPTLLADLAHVALYQQDIEEACALIAQAIALATQMQLQKVVQRLISMQEALKPWEEVPSVKTLKTHLTFLGSWKSEIL